VRVIEDFDGNINYIPTGCSRLETLAMGEHIRSGKSTPIFGMYKSPFSWPLNFSNPIPHKYRPHKLRSKLRARQSPASSIAAVETSFSPFITLRALRAHRWSIYDAQYLLLLALGIFVLCISPSPGPLLKTVAVALLVTVLLVPVTSQFFFPFLPILTWLVFFFSCR
jgi:inositol phosphorylceramide synthase catalytic subunit